MKTKLPLEVICRLRVHCAACQASGEADDKFRASLEDHYVVPAGFPACPYALGTRVPEVTRASCAEMPVVGEKTVYPDSVNLTVGKTFRGMLLGEPPPPTMEQAASFLEAQLTAKTVPLEVAQERAATCATCPHARWSTAKGVPWCSRCGCTVGGVGRWFLKLLTQVEENLPKWGCHHPERAKGGGWKR